MPRGPIILGSSRACFDFNLTPHYKMINVNFEFVASRKHVEIWFYCTVIIGSSKDEMYFLLFVDLACVFFLYLWAKKIDFTSCKFSCQSYLVSFHWNLSDSKSSQASWTLSILADLNNAVVWIVFILPLNSNYSNHLSMPLWTVSSAPPTISITVTLMFLSHWGGVGWGVKIQIYLLICSLSLIFTLCPFERQNPQDNQYFLLSFIHNPEVKSSDLYQVICFSFKIPG